MATVSRRERELREGERRLAEQREATEARITTLERELSHEKSDTKRLRANCSSLEEMLNAEWLHRVNAQLGLLPYVEAVEKLNVWLRERPELLTALAPVLIALGLYGMEVGEDPRQDPRVQEALATGVLPQPLKAPRPEPQERAWLRESLARSADDKRTRHAALAGMSHP